MGVEAWKEGEGTVACEGIECQLGLSGIGRRILGRTSPVAFSRGRVRAKDLLFSKVVPVGVLIRKYRIRVRTGLQTQRGEASLGEVFSGSSLHSLGRRSSRCPST